MPFASFKVFCLLVFEMGVFMGLILPLPFSVKRKLFTFISESPVVAKLQYGLKVRKWLVYHDDRLVSFLVIY